MTTTELTQQQCDILLAEKFPTLRKSYPVNPMVDPSGYVPQVTLAALYAEMLRKGPVTMKGMGEYIECEWLGFTRFAPHATEMLDNDAAIVLLAASRAAVAALGLKEAS